MITKFVIIGFMLVGQSNAHPGSQALQAPPREFTTEADCFHHLAHYRDLYEQAPNSRRYDTVEGGSKGFLMRCVQVPADSKVQ